MTDLSVHLFTDVTLFRIHIYISLQLSLNQMIVHCIAGSTTLTQCTLLTEWQYYGLQINVKQHDIWKLLIKHWKNERP